MTLLREYFMVLILAIFALMGMFRSFRHARQDTKTFWSWLDHWFADFSTELAGAALISFAVLIIVTPAKNAETLNSQIQLMRSRIDTIAITATEQLRASGALYDGSLRGIDISLANLEGANLEKADLQDSNLELVYFVDSILAGANLSNVWARGSNFSGANLMDANIESARLIYGRFQGTRLNNVNAIGTGFLNSDLSNADFSGADLRNAVFLSANLDGANLTNAYLLDAELDFSLGANRTTLDETTILPDGTYWTPDTDMERFTNANHPNFWNPCVSEALQYEINLKTIKYCESSSDPKWR